MLNQVNDIIRLHSSIRTIGIFFIRKFGWINETGHSINRLWISVPRVYENAATALMYAVWSWQYRNIYWTSEVCAWKWNDFCLKWCLVSWGSIKSLCRMNFKDDSVSLSCFLADLCSQVGTDNCMEKLSCK